MHSSGTIGNGSAPTRAGRHWGAWLIVAATIIICAACAILIWYRFTITPETNCTIVVNGDKTMDGNVVEVMPRVAPDPSRSHLKVTLQEKNQYSARFFLTSGTYQVTIHRPDGSTVIDVTDFIPPGRRWTYDVVRQRPTGRPYGATQPAPKR